MQLRVENLNLTRLNVSIGTMSRQLRLKESDVVKVQSALFQKDMVKDLPPKNLAKSKAKAAVEVKHSVYAPVGEMSFFKGEQAGQANGKTVWLYAHKKGVVGVGRKDLKDRVTGKGLMEIHRAQQKRNRAEGWKAKWLDFGKRGKQHVQIINKPVVSKSGKKSLIKQVQDKYGKLKASFAIGWEELRVRGSLPNWIKKHIPEMRKRGSKVLVNLGGDKPNVTIISTATGCTSDQISRVINRNITKRSAAMLKDLRHYLSGKKKIEDFGKGILN